jgi:type VI secretion system protein
MAIRLKVIGGKAAATGRRGGAVFGVRGGRIGRAPDNDWVLADPDRYVSSHHVAVDHRAGQWWVTDLSRNGTFLNDERRAIGAGGRRQLETGDLLRIADYEILVEITPEHELPPESPPADGDFIETRIDFDADERRDLRPAPVEGSGAGGRSGPPHDRGADRNARRVPAEEPRAASPPLRGEDRELWPGIQALCRGAGIEPAELSADARAALLYQAGQLLRELAVGFHELEQARAEFARDYSPQTAPGHRDGSGRHSAPIDVDATLRRWLTGDAPAGLVESARRGFADARRHDFAVAIALKAAVNDLLLRMDPDELEMQFGRGTRVALDAATFARYWQRFREVFRSFAQPGDSGVPAAFAEEFGRAYRRMSASVGSDPEQR